VTPVPKKFVEILTTPEIELEELFQALHKERLRIRVGGELQIVVTISQLAEELSEIAAIHRTDGRDWLLVTISGDCAGVGPLFSSNRAPCWDCMARRMRLNGQNPLTSPIQQRRYSKIVALAAREASTWLNRGRSRTIGRWIAVNTEGRERSHPLIAACPVCINRSKRVPLVASKLTSAVSGIVAHLETAELHRGLFRSTAVCAQALFPDHALRFMPEARQSVDGKGESGQMAIRSCLGEAVERYSITFQGDESRIRAAYRDIQRKAIHPHSLILASERQHRRRNWWLGHHGSFHWIKEPFIEDCEIEWLDAADASTGEIRLVPAEYCLLGYGGRFANADSNGCAAGLTRWQAARNAVLELVERDAVAIWWYNRLHCPPLHWRALGSERIDRLAQILGRLKRNFWLLDVTTDLGIPVCVAVSHDASGAHIALGSGADVAAERAAWRAMCEMVTQAIEMNRLRRPSSRNMLALWKWWQFRRIADQSYLRGAGKARHPPASTFRGSRAEFYHCLQRIEAAGIRVLLYDHTRPELKVPVIRAIAPGLRHFWARFAPGRLYDVPVKLGHLRKPLCESELNPIPYFL
jgi:oxazoline/thiazoline synthase